MTTEAPTGALPDAKPRWKKADAPRFTASTTADDALANIIVSCVSHLKANEACVLARAHEEGVHQMRVAVRRLRSALALYRRNLPADQHDYLSGELRWLIGELGPARDWDVFVADIFEPVGDGLHGEETLTLLRARIDAKRDEAYATAQAALASQRYFGLILLLEAWAQGRRWRPPAERGRPSDHPLMAPAVTIASGMLEEGRRAVLDAGAGFEELSATERHRVRIAIKKMRYAIEFFGSLYPRRKVEPFLQLLKTLQDELGARNDVDVARKLLRRVTRGVKGKERAQLRYASGLIVGWHSHLGDDAEGRVVRDWRRFVEKEPFWPKPPEPAIAPRPAEPEPAAQETPAEDAAFEPAEAAVYDRAI